MSLAALGQAGLGSARRGMRDGRLAGTGVRALGVLARHGGARRVLGAARQGDGRVEHIQVRVLDAHAWSGRDRIGTAPQGSAWHGLTGKRMGVRHTPGFESLAPAAPHGMAAHGSAGRGCAWSGVDGRCLAWQGNGWASGPHRSSSLRRPREAGLWLGCAGPGEASRGRDGGRLAATPGSRPGRPRKAGIGRAARGSAGQRRAVLCMAGQGQAGDWQSSGFETQTPTHGEVRPGEVSRGGAGPGMAWKAGERHTSRFESATPTEGQRTTSPATGRDTTPAQRLRKGTQ